MPKAATPYTSAWEARTLTTASAIGYRACYSRSTETTASWKRNCTAWGFHKLFLNVKHVDDTPIRREIQQYLGSRPTYYRYMNGQLTLTPGQQAGIISIFLPCRMATPKN